MNPLLTSFSLSVLLLTQCKRQAEKDQMEANSAAKEIATLGMYLNTWTLGGGGGFPEDLDELATEADRYGIDLKWLERLKPGIIEYRGEALSNADHGSLLLLRYRPGPLSQTEVRLLVNGSCLVVPAGTPIPEDAAKAGDSGR